MMLKTMLLNCDCVINNTNSYNCLVILIINSEAELQCYDLLDLWYFQISIWEAGLKGAELYQTALFRFLLFKMAANINNI